MNTQLLIFEAEQHKAACSVLAAWIVREVPVAWKWIKTSAWTSLVKIYPYISTHGGIWSVVKAFFIGVPKTTTNNQQVISQ